MVCLRKRKPSMSHHKLVLWGMMTLVGLVCAIVLHGWFCRVLLVCARARALVIRAGFASPPMIAGPLRSVRGCCPLIIYARMTIIGPNASILNISSARRAAGGMDPARCLASIHLIRSWSLPCLLLHALLAASRSSPGGS